MIKQIFALLLLACLLNLLATIPALADEEEEKGGRGCISLRTLKKTAVVDDRNILFIKVGNKTVYHNILPKQCTGLSRLRAFSYSTNSGSLCNFDTIQILNEHGREGKSCRLGYFHEMTMDEIPALVEGLSRAPESEPRPPADVEEIIEEPGEAAESMPN